MLMQMPLGAMNFEQLEVFTSNGRNMRALIEYIITHPDASQGL